MGYKQKIRLIKAKFSGCPKLTEELISDIPKPPKSKFKYLLRCIWQAIKNL